MTTGSWLCVTVAVALALVDWTSIVYGRRLVDLIVKPLVPASLMVAALLAHPVQHGVQLPLVLALAFGTAGDLAPVAREPISHTVLWQQTRNRFFIAGLTSFLLVHVLYAVAMLAHDVDWPSAVFGLALVFLSIGACGQRIVRGAYRQGGRPLAVAVTCYVVAMGASVTLGVGTNSLLIAYGSVLFAGSDLVLAYDRFVKARSWSRITVIVSYHLAQVALLIGLVR
ncbi:hypothetical protein BH10ACT8_BH10ACT8_00160 [soil metagenome]|jgi:uncharacterized membrane protein YhhN